MCRQLPSLAQDTHKQFPPQQVIRLRHHNYHCGHHQHFDHQQDNQLSPDNFLHHFQSNHTPLKLDLDDNHSSEEELEDIIGTKKVSTNFFIFCFVCFSHDSLIESCFCRPRSCLPIDRQDHVLDTRDHQEPSESCSRFQ